MNKCNDTWKEKDKMQHCAVCFLIALLSPQAAMGAALGKEYGDMRARGNHWCWKDVAADAIGIALGTLLHILLFFLIINKISHG